MSNEITGRPNIVWGDAIHEAAGGKFAGYVKVSTAMTTKPYIPDVLSTLGLGAWTVEAWVKVDGDAYTGNQAAIFMADMRSDNNARATVYLQKNQHGLPWGDVRGLVLSCAGKHSPATVEFPVDGSWHHVAFVYDGAEYRLYQDGVKVNELSANAPQWRYGDHMSLASQDANNDSRFNGGYDDIRVTRQARYTQDFTPPASPFVKKALTKLLDPHLPYRRICIQAEGTEGGSKITDVFGHTVNKLGQPYISLKQAKVGTGSVAFERRNPCALNVTGSDIVRNDNNACYEAWIYATSYSGDFNMVFDTRNPANDATGFFLTVRSDGTLRAWSGTGDRANMDHQNRIRLNTWHHVAVAIGDNRAKIYLDGVPSNGTLTWGTHNFDTFLIGKSCNAATDLWDGYMDDIRVTIGHAVHAAPFTPPDAPYTRTKDWPADDPHSAECISAKRGTEHFPDADLAGLEWIAHSKNQGWVNTGARGFDRMKAMGFDGAQDEYVRTKDILDLGQADWTVEFYIYSHDLSGFKPLFMIGPDGEDNSQHGIWVLTQDEQLRFDVANSGGAHMVPCNRKTWIHVCVERQGNKWYAYTNGRCLDINGFDTNNAVSGYAYLGGSGGTIRYSGLITNFKLYKGVAVHGGQDFTPAWAISPLTGKTPYVGYGPNGAPSTTGVYDFEHGKGDILEAGTVTSAEHHWGGKSMVCANSGTRAHIPSALNKLGSGAFTEEFFVKLNGDQPNLACFLSANAGRVDLGTVTIFLLGGKLRLSTPNDKTATAPVDFPKDAWVHVAFTFDGTMYRGYQNGQLVCSVENVAPVFAANQNIGISNNSGFEEGSSGFNGWIDDIRLTRGLARYTEDTFTVPTEYTEKPTVDTTSPMLVTLLHFEE